MDRLESVLIAGRNLDRAMDEELLARTPEDRAKARAKVIAAKREWVRAQAAVHERRVETTG